MTASASLGAKPDEFAAMRVGYAFVHLGSPVGDGVAAKIADHITTWSSYGIDVFAAPLVANAYVKDWQGWMRGLACHGRVFDAAGKSLRGRQAAASRMVQFLVPRVDCVYLRLNTVVPAFLALENRVPVILEISSNMIGEARLRSLPHVYAWRRFSHWSLIRGAAGVVSAFPTDLHETVPHFVLPNGYNDQTRPVRPASLEGRPRAVMLVANSNPWNGVDRLLQLARSQRSVDFDLLGPFSPTDSGGLSLPDNVFPSGGRLAAGEIRPFLERATVGIGPLASERKGVRVGSSLKIREYLAHGLPVVLGSDDIAIPNEADWALKHLFNSNQSAFSLFAGFVSRWRGRRVSRGQVAHMSSGVIERRRVDFMRSVVETP